jgi:hypothetical protein
MPGVESSGLDPRHSVFPSRSSSACGQHRRDQPGGLLAGSLKQFPRFRQAKKGAQPKKVPGTRFIRSPHTRSRNESCRGGARLPPERPPFRLGRLAWSAPRTQRLLQTQPRGRLPYPTLAPKRPAPRHTRLQRCQLRLALRLVDPCQPVARQRHRPVTQQAGRRDVAVLPPPQARLITVSSDTGKEPVNWNK